MPEINVRVCFGSHFAVGVLVQHLDTGSTGGVVFDSSVLDPRDFDRVAGLYVLHFDSPVDYRTPGCAPGEPGAYGDAQHYVGESTNVGKRVRKHMRNGGSSAAFVRTAHEQGVRFHLAFVRPIGDHETRLRVEKAAQHCPPRWCGTCAAHNRSGPAR